MTTTTTTTSKLPQGCSYAMKVLRVHEIYDQYKRTGLSNRTIWRRYIHPELGICESTFYRISKVNPDLYKAAQ